MFAMQRLASAASLALLACSGPSAVAPPTEPSDTPYKLGTFSEDDRQFVGAIVGDN